MWTFPCSGITQMSPAMQLKYHRVWAVILTDQIHLGQKMPHTSYSVYKVVVGARGSFASPAHVQQQARPLKLGRRAVCCFASHKYSQLVKVCGVVTPEDARYAASEGADLIGMILWPKAGRSVSLETAKKIASEAREQGSRAVGVFVDEDAGAITDICADVGIDIAQLHGDAARSAFEALPPDLSVIYVVHADSSGQVQTDVSHLSRMPDWFLVDSLKGGSGTRFDWRSVRPPTSSRHGWLLAGGLTDDNVESAIEIARPDGVDVSSGVCDDTKVAKDPTKVSSYVRRAQRAFKEN